MALERSVRRPRRLPRKTTERLKKMVAALRAISDLLEELFVKQGG